MARHFTAASGDYIDLGTGVRGGDLFGILVMAWVKPGDITAERKVVARWGTGATEQYLLTTAPVGAGGAFVPVWNILDSGLTGHGQVGVTALASGTWYHIAGMYDGAINYVLVNGAVDSQTTLNVSLNHTTTTHTYIGKADDGNPYDGAIAEVSLSVVNTAISPAGRYLNVVAACAAGASPSDCEGLVETEHIDYYPLHGDSPEQTYAIGGDAGTVHGTTVVNHPGIRSLTSWRGV